MQTRPVAGKGAKGHQVIRLYTGEEQLLNRQSPEIARTVGPADQDWIGEPVGSAQRSGMSPAEFNAYIKAEIAKWRGVIEKGGIPKT